MSKTIQIIEGPSKWDLAQALMNQQGTITIRLANGESMTGEVHGVQKEDASGESWNIDFYTNGIKRLYYRTDSCKGVFHL